MVVPCNRILPLWNSLEAKAVSGTVHFIGGSLESSLLQKASICSKEKLNSYFSPFETIRKSGFDL